ncbi:MAG TPA: HNH endonuclease signature motif containing protein [Actinomycetota bacterium]|nr:HNH endonuclease signature motif containing protein [Actinomycetota bacterium]
MEITEAVKASRSFAQVLAKLRIRQGGGAQARLKRRVESLGLDTSHFMGQGWRLGDERPTVPAVPLEQVLVIGRLTQTSDLRRRLIQAGLKDAKCEVCGLDTWRGNPIPLELDHVNGLRDDNRLSNLRLLCPNCHAQTPTYRGRNVGLSSPYSDSGPGAGM